MTKKKAFISQDDYNYLYDLHGRAPTKAEKEAFQAGEDRAPKPEATTADYKRLEKELKLDLLDLESERDIVRKTIYGYDGEPEQDFASRRNRAISLHYFYTGTKAQVLGYSANRLNKDGTRDFRRKKDGAPVEPMEYAPPGTDKWECIEVMRRNGVPADQLAYWERMAQRIDDRA